jgi:DNA-binding response OmpR family regulator
MPTRGAGRQGQKPRPVVILDSSSAVRGAADKQLSAAGYKVVATNDAARIGDLVRTCDPCLVLCELALPDSDGFAILKTLQSDPRTAAHPVVFLTAPRARVEKDDPFRFGLVGHVAKPLTGTRLVRKVEDVLAGLETRPGRLAAEDTAGLQARIRRESRTGVLSVRGPSGSFQGTIRAGEPVDEMRRTSTEAGHGSEFVELDPTCDQIVARDPAAQALAVPDFSLLPEALRTVLVVDDSPFFRAFLKGQLVRHKFHVFEAADGEEALRLALAHRHWLIITDMSMPRMNGLEFCRRVRSHSLIGHTPLIFLSGWDDFKYRDHALGAGADEYLSKEASARELLIRIHLILSRFAALGGPSREGLGGAVDAIGMTGLFQMCHMTTLTGTLAIRSGLRTCEVCWRDGEIVAASLDQARGGEAVYEALGWTRGTFEFRPGDPGEHPPLGKSFERLLLEGCQRVDERRAGKDRPLTEDRASEP